MKTIPETIHQIWLGDAPQPVKCMNSVRRRNPGYKYHRWTSVQQILDALYLDDYRPDPLAALLTLLSRREVSPLVLSDIARVLLLHKFGGWFIDADQYLLAPIGPVYDAWQAQEPFATFYAFRHPAPPPHSREPLVGLPANGVIGATARHDLLSFIGMNILRSFSLDAPAHLATGPHAIWNEDLGMISDYVPHWCYAFKDSRYFYPFHWDEVAGLSMVAEAIDKCPNHLDDDKLKASLDDRLPNPVHDRLGMSLGVQFWGTTQTNWLNNHGSAYGAENYLQRRKIVGCVYG